MNIQETPPVFKKNYLDNPQGEPNTIKLDKKLKMPAQTTSYLLILFLPSIFIFSLLFMSGFNDKLLGFLTLFTILFLLLIAYTIFYYDSISFIVTNHSVVIYWGILTRKSKTILFDSIQAMDSNSGLLMRMFNITKFKIYITSPNQININQRTITKSPDYVVILTFAQADWLADFISKTKNNK